MNIENINDIGNDPRIMTHEENQASVGSDTKHRLASSGKSSGDEGKSGSGQNIDDRALRTTRQGAACC
jgi:hypothetical protein